MTDIIDLALACYRKPLDYQDRFSLTAPLPEGMGRLLWLANGSPEALEAGIRQTGAKPQELRDAARFCVQQWCLVRSADPHRVLGVEPGAPPEQVKEHYRLLMRLFHPDRAAGRETWTDHYASRVTEAWTVLSRTQDSAVSNHQAGPRSIPDQNSARPLPNRAVERLGPLFSRHPSRRRRRRAWRRWLPRLALGGLALIVMIVLGGFYLDRFSVSRGGFEPASARGFTPPLGAARAPELVTTPTDSGAFSPFMAAPDWQALEQREQQVHRQVVQAREARQQWEEDRQQQLVAEEALLESMREERAQLEEQVKTEQARMKQVRAERLAAEQQQLARLQAEQARMEQARTERKLTDRRRLEALQAEQAKAERLAEELRIERQRLERLKVEQARVEQSKSERVRAEQARLEAAANRAPAMRMAVTAETEEQDLTAGELESLMNRYIRAYQRGDLSGVMALFATGPRSQIRGDYATLFANHYIRGFWLHDLRWAYRGQSASGSGRYQLQLRRRDNGEQHQVEGRIRFTVQKRDRQLLIEAIDYDWPEKG